MHKYLGGHISAFFCMLEDMFMVNQKELNQLQLIQNWEEGRKGGREGKRKPKLTCSHFILNKSFSMNVPI